MSEVGTALTREEMILEVKRRAQVRLEEIGKRRERYDTDLEAFSADCLTVRPKAGGDTLLRFNSVQRVLHQRLEEQRQRTGRVRALVVKARKHGVSTYIEARFYHKVSRQRGIRAFILTHKDEATNTIFDMAQRFHERNPHAPHTGKSNAKELYFDEIDSGFGVGTAGAKGVGRGETIQLFHWSESAHSPNAEEHATGALEAVPDMAGTEIILESTANGASGLFYNMCQAARRGQSGYQVIFLPWFIHEEYASTAPAGWRPPEAFIEYGSAHGLTRAQLHWAFSKNAELAAVEGDGSENICWRFRQEFPATIEEAFRASREGRFIRSEAVAAARRNQIADQSHAPVILGCDFATGGDSEGGDINVFIDRQGRRAGKKVYERLAERNTVVVANRLGSIIERIKPDMCFLDVGGGGAQVYDILVTRGFRDVLTLVNFGSKATDDKKYANKRAEIWSKTRDWVNDPGGVDIPDDDLLDGELTAPKGGEDLNQRVLIEPKKAIRKELGASPDGGDALALTFSEPVRKIARAATHDFSPADEKAGY